MPTCPYCDGDGKCSDSFHTGTLTEGGPDMIDHVFGHCSTCGNGNTESNWDTTCTNCDGTGNVD